MSLLEHECPVCHEECICRACDAREKCEGGGCGRVGGGLCGPCRERYDGVDGLTITAARARIVELGDAIVNVRGDLEKYKAAVVRELHYNMTRVLRRQSDEDAELAEARKRVEALKSALRMFVELHSKEPESRYDRAMRAADAALALFDNG